MTSQLTDQDVAKAMQKESKRSGGNIPADSRAAGLQSLQDAESKNKEALIEERKANLPLPDDPPRGPGDFNSASQDAVNVSSSSRQDDVTIGSGATTGELDSAAGVGNYQRGGQEFNTK